MTATARAAALLALLLAACTRPIEVTSEPRAVFAILVHNEFAEPMIVSYDDSRGDALLGTVPANSSQRFEIGNPARNRITLQARNAAGSRRSGPHTVDLVAHTVPTVRLR
jgi:hypothetical protein